MTMAQTFGSYEAPFWLTRSVARVISINLTDAMAEGQLTPYTYAVMVMACRGASCSGRCAEWLAAQPGGIADDPPPFCVNAREFSALKAACAPSARDASDR